MRKFIPSMCKLSFILIVIFSIYNYSEATKCQNLQPNQTEKFEVKFWEIFPYTTKNSTKNERKPKGLFNLLNEHLTTSTPLNFKWPGAPSPFMDILNQSEGLHTGSTNKIVLPVAFETDDKDPCNVKVYESTGLAYVVRRNVKKPLNQLAGSFINGGQVIGLTLILTGIAGICMWLLDRRRNPVDFPAPFIRGSWQGFWWAFVTMTTVGYGDLAPKSVPARMFSILWMLLGLVAFSVLTANFTSSLAREIETDLNLFNKKVKTIAVLKGSINRQAAIDVGGKYYEYENLNHVIDALRDKNVEGFLIDKHIVVSHHQIIFDDQLEIGKMLEYKFNWGMKLLMKKPEMCVPVKNCIEAYINKSPFKDILLQVLSNATISKDDVEHRGSLFEDAEFFIILIALFSVMTGAGVLWEYFYYRPNLSKKDSNDDEENEMNDRTLKYIMTNSEVKSLCETCCNTVEGIYEKEGEQRHEHLKNIDNDRDRQSPSNLLQNVAEILPTKNLFKGKSKVKDKETF